MTSPKMGPVWGRSSADSPANLTIKIQFHTPKFTTWRGIFQIWKGFRSNIDPYCPSIWSYIICLVTYKLSSRAYQLCARSSVYTVLTSLSECMRPCKSFTHHKKKKLSFIMFKKYTQGVGGRGLSCDFQKMIFGWIFTSLMRYAQNICALRSSSYLLPLIEMGVDIRGPGAE